MVEAELAELERCAVYRGETRTYIAKMKIGEEDILIDETTRFSPNDIGETFEFGLEAFGQVLEVDRDERSQSIEIDEEKWVNEFDTVVLEAGESVIIDLEGYKIGYQSADEELIDKIEEGDILRVRVTLYLV